MVEKMELAGVLGFGLLIGAFFGFVLSHGDALFAGVGAVVLAVIAVVYAFMLGEADSTRAV